MKSVQDTCDSSPAVLADVQPSKERWIALLLNIVRYGTGTVQRMSPPGRPTKNIATSMILQFTSFFVTAYIFRAGLRIRNTGWLQCLILFCARSGTLFVLAVYSTGLLFVTFLRCLQGIHCTREFFCKYLPVQCMKKSKADTVIVFLASKISLRVSWSTPTHSVIRWADHYHLLFLEF